MRGRGAQLCEVFYLAVFTGELLVKVTWLQTENQDRHYLDADTKVEALPDGHRLENSVDRVAREFHRFLETCGCKAPIANGCPAASACL